MEKNKPYSKNPCEKKKLIEKTTLGKKPVEKKLGKKLRTKTKPEKKTTLFKKQNPQQKIKTQNKV